MHIIIVSDELMSIRETVSIAIHKMESYPAPNLIELETAKKLVRKLTRAIKKQYGHKCGWDMNNDREWE